LRYSSYHGVHKTHKYRGNSVFPPPHTHTHTPTSSSCKTSKWILIKFVMKLMQLEATPNLYN
jgi:hypothetical protein